MVSKTIGANTNVTDTATIKNPISLNASTSTTISSADSARIFFNVNNNDSTKGFWVKLQAASVDNVKKGIYITSKIGSNPAWEMPSLNIYTGEICAIAEVDSPDAYVTEY